jgi:hypothetical protein
MQDQTNHITEREALKIFEVIAPIYCQTLPPVLKVSQIMRLLKVSRETVTAWIGSKKFIPEIMPGFYSTPALLYWLICNEFLNNKSTEDRLADRIAAEAIFSLSKNMLEEGE